MIENKFAIIGRGLAGLNLSLRLTEAGYAPLVFGESHGSANASRCAQGIVCNKGLIFADSPLFQAKLQSLPRMRPWLKKLEDLSSTQISQQMKGVVEPYWDEDDFRKTVQRVYRGNFWGCYRARNIPGHEWRPPISYEAQVLGFLAYPDDGWFDVGQALDALEKAASGQGARFVNERVTGIDRSPHGLLIRAGSRTWTVEHLVLAAGAGTSELMETLGLRFPKSFLVAGQSLSWNHLNQELHDAKQRVMVKGTLSLAVGEQRSILGSTSWKPEAGVAPDLKTDAIQLLQSARRSFGLALTQEELAGIQNAWGVRLRFSDRMPALGRWPEADWHERLSVLTGFYKNGLQLADICAEQLCRELFTQDLNEFGQAFHIRRFFKS